MLFCSSCALRFTYNNLDWVVPWYTDDYVTLNASQKKLFEQRFQRYWDWHRKTQLPRYSALLRDTAEALKAGLVDKTASMIETRTTDLTETLVRKMEPDLLALLPTLSAKQLREIQAKFAKDNKKHREEYIDASAEQQRDKRAERIESSLERWFGQLNEAQLALIAQAAGDYQLMGEESLQARLAWQQAFIDALQLRQQQTEFSAALSRLFANRELGRSPAFQEKLAHNQGVLAELYKKLDKSLSKQQRERAVSRLLDYAKEFDQLAKE